MPKTSFSVGEHELELICESSGKEYIIYDNQIISEQQNSLTLSSIHNFEVSESAEVANYSVSFKSTISGLIKYNVKKYYFRFNKIQCEPE
ncbi:hypothetical protein [Okeania sp. SIO2B3]|uniref:hypothetical protein n=1 Tax=Okeania sp. SIO2B3 TaxID=2607784 RepID=UPI0013C1B513|nr:hypothetical protein [Okeania sp. SIO2B3]NET40543.1 hypothetical protein [Okeania sp. SIO2B3]